MPYRTVIKVKNNNSVKSGKVVTIENIISSSIEMMFNFSGPVTL